MRLVIAGGREFSDYEFLKREVDQFVLGAEEVIVISGKARGADSLGEKYAKERGYGLEDYPANWKLFGKRAGFVRNRQMGESADAVICFWDGYSKGTKHMIDLAKELDRKLLVVRY
ncbi:MULTISPECIES: DUF2493 domain-containing protein [unclassified Psychrobacillus]|uniref:DUF2493 domain-containing protein n=1 Tax=unclassified Psychrobacillus TaxID=2636677 RepID=UPI0030F77307